MEDNEVKLTEEEITTIRAYQQNIEAGRATLGALRQNYLASEKRTLEIIAKANSDYLAHIKVLAESKEIPAQEEWFFDPSNYTFKKKD